MLRFAGLLFLFNVTFGFTTGRYFGPGGRIVGGSDTDISKYPYQVSVQQNGAHSCGGSIISADYILTAAHCFGAGHQYNVRVGSSLRNEGGVEYEVADIIINDNYSSDVFDFDYDIALLRLASPIKFSELAQPVALAEDGGETAAGTPAVVTGWGLLAENGQLSDVLQKVVVPIVGNEDCNKVYWSITSRMLCAGYQEGGRDACTSDSGGPLVANGKQIGIVSFGIGCAQPSIPGVYSNVATLRSWIREKSGI